MGQAKFRNFMILAGLLSKGSLEKQVHKLSREENRKLYNIFMGAQ